MRSTSLRYALQSCPVARNRVILEIPPHHLREPLPRLLRRCVHALSQFGPHLFEPGCHAPADRLPMHGEFTRLMIGPTNVSETQTAEGLRLLFSPLPPSFSGIAPEFNQACLLWVQFQPELPQPFPQLLQKPFCVFPSLEPQHAVVGVAHDNHLTVRLLLPPCLGPQIQHVMQVEIG